jgi:CRISPR-associated endonuclease Csy4
MKYYLDITLLPDAEANLGFIWKKVFQQIHIALVDNKIGDNESAVALSIVNYGDTAFPLGNHLRLLANTKQALQKLDIHRWLSRLDDYCHIKLIKPVPTDISVHASFRRKPVKSIEKKAQRRAMHLNKPYDEVLAYLRKENRSEKSELPFINAESQQSKGRLELGESPYFLIFVERVFTDKPVVGKFDCYGFSRTATVPWF